MRLPQGSGLLRGCGPARTSDSGEQSGFDVRARSWCCQESERSCPLVSHFRRARKRGRTMQSGVLCISSGKVSSKTIQRQPDGFVQAADQGFAPAQDNLASMYNSGMGVPRDYFEAANGCSEPRNRDTPGRKPTLATSTKRQRCSSRLCQRLHVVRVCSAGGDERGRVRMKDLSRLMTSARSPKHELGRSCEPAGPMPARSWRTLNKGCTVSSPSNPTLSSRSTQLCLQPH